MKVVVCGSRERYIADHFAVARAVHDRLRTLPAGSVVVHGASPGGGVDDYAEMAAWALGLAVIPVPISEADRARAREMGRPRFAPLARTVRMFDEHPDLELVLAWRAAGSPGTGFTIAEAGRRGIPVEVVDVTSAAQGRMLGV